MTYFMENPSVESVGNKLETLDAIYPHQQTKPQRLCRRKLKIASLLRSKANILSYTSSLSEKEKSNRKVGPYSTPIGVRIRIPCTQ